MGSKGHNPSHFSISVTSVIYISYIYEWHIQSSSSHLVICVIAGEDVAHFLVSCGEFERYGLVLLDDVCRIVGAREWLGEFWRVDEEGEVALLLGKGVEGKGWRAYVTE